ncbi:polyprotein [Plakobranchus ocellatus]|uniref:Polyprotein n=1 Tax=Plakobranchus ocellatus TaxID=259542 RepID=A0AAV3ZGB7_9GAST|nr:polyprotein [Plakobranchus ocellatus]
MFPPLAISESHRQRRQLAEKFSWPKIMSDISNTLSDIRGKTNGIEHQIRQTDHEPFIIKRYSILLHAKGRDSGRYWQILMREVDKKYTIFQTSRGLMELTYMPFGFSKAACTFQKAMKATLGALAVVVSYFDVLVFSRSWEERLEHVEKTLDTLQRANFTIKPSKTTVGNKYLYRYLHSNVYITCINASSITT